jgi:hypothetical protein
VTTPRAHDSSNPLRLPREADALPQVERARLFGHPMPIGVDLDGHVREGTRLLSAHAAGLFGRTS